MKISHEAASSNFLCKIHSIKENQKQIPYSLFVFFITNPQAVMLMTIVMIIFFREYLIRFTLKKKRIELLFKTDTKISDRNCTFMPSNKVLTIR